MRLRPGAQHYEHRNHTDDPGPVWVRHKNTHQVGYVSRSCPSGRNTPAQAYIVFQNDDTWNGLWINARDLERVGEP